MTLQEFLRVLSRRRRALLGTGLVFALTAVAGLVGYTAVADRSVVVKSRLIVMGEMAERTYYSLDTAPAASEIARVLADSADTEVFLADVRAELGSSMSIARLRQAVAVTSVEGVPIVEIAVTTTTAASAEQISGAVLSALSGMAEELAQQRLTGDATITTRVVMEPLLVDRDALPLVPIAIFVLVAAFAFGVLVALARDVFDRKVRDAATVRGHTDPVPVVDSIEAVRARVASLGSQGRTVLVLPIGRCASEPLAEELAEAIRAWEEQVVLVQRDAGGSARKDAEGGASKSLVRTVLLDSSRPASETLSPSRLETIRRDAAGATVVLALDGGAWQTTLQILPPETRYIVGTARLGATKIDEIRDAAMILAPAGPDDAVILAS